MVRYWLRTAVAVRCDAGHQPLAHTSNSSGPPKQPVERTSRPAPPVPPLAADKPLAQLDSPGSSAAIPSPEPNSGHTPVRGTVAPTSPSAPASPASPDQPTAAQGDAGATASVALPAAAPRVPGVIEDKRQQEGGHRRWRAYYGNHTIGRASSQQRAAALRDQYLDDHSLFQGVWQPVMTREQRAAELTAAEKEEFAGLAEGIDKVATRARTLAANRRPLSSMSPAVLKTSLTELRSSVKVLISLLVDSATSLEAGLGTVQQLQLQVAGLQDELVAARAEAESLREVREARKLLEACGLGDLFSNMSAVIVRHLLPLQGIFFSYINAACSNVIRVADGGREKWLPRLLDFFGTLFTASSAKAAIQAMRGVGDQGLHLRGKRRRGAYAEDGGFGGGGSEGQAQQLVLPSPSLSTIRRWVKSKATDPGWVDGASKLAVRSFAALSEQRLRWVLDRTHKGAARVAGGLAPGDEGDEGDEQQAAAGREVREAAAAGDEQQAAAGREVREVAAAGDEQQAAAGREVREAAAAEPVGGVAAHAAGAVADAAAGTGMDTESGGLGSADVDMEEADDVLSVSSGSSDDCSLLDSDTWSEDGEVEEVVLPGDAAAALGAGDGLGTGPYVDLPSGARQAAEVEAAKAEARFAKATRRPQPSGADRIYATLHMDSTDIAGDERASGDMTGGAALPGAFGGVQPGNTLGTCKHDSRGKALAPFGCCLKCKPVSRP